MGASLRARWEAQVQRTEGCWIWTGAINTSGYGVITTGGAAQQRVRKAHRVAYELLVGPIPEGLVIDHLCRVTHCVNPNHLEPVTQRENTLRGIGPSAENARKTHCPQGHAYDAENTYERGGRRYCRECNRAHCAAYRRRRAQTPTDEGNPRPLSVA